MATEVPVGAKILAVLSFIGAAFSLLGGAIILITTGTGAIGFLEEYPISPTGAVAIGIGLLGLAVLNVFVGRGLWLGQNWARLFLIITQGIGAIFNIWSLLQGDLGVLTSLTINILILWYLWLNESIRAAFTENE